MNASSPTRTKKVALLVILLCALAALLIYNLRSNRFNESELRDTAGIQVNITKSQQTPQGILIVYTIENHSQKTASSIVLTAQVRDNADKPIAANPLINILNLTPGEKRTQTAIAPYLPNIQPTSTFKPILQATLVRWME